jgi:hypothetical protein
VVRKEKKGREGEKRDIDRWRSEIDRWDKFTRTVVMQNRKSAGIREEAHIQNACITNLLSFRHR